MLKKVLFVLGLEQCLTLNLMVIGTRYFRQKGFSKAERFEKIIV